MPQGHADDAFLKYATDELHEHFEIEHVTIQVVRVPFSPPCAALEPVGTSTTATAFAAQPHAR